MRARPCQFGPLPGWASPGLTLAGKGTSGKRRPAIPWWSATAMKRGFGGEDTAGRELVEALTPWPSSLPRLTSKSAAVALTRRAACAAAGSSAQCDAGRRAAPGPVPLAQRTAPGQDLGAAPPRGTPIGPWPRASRCLYLTPPLILALSARTCHVAKRHSRHKQKRRKRQPLDPVQLLENARVRLRQGQAREAIDVLKQARHGDGGSERLDLALACAYCLRARQLAARGMAGEARAMRERARDLSGALARPVSDEEERVDCARCLDMADAVAVYGVMSSAAERRRIVPGGAAHQRRRRDGLAALRRRPRPAGGTAPVVSNGASLMTECALTPSDGPRATLMAESALTPRDPLGHD